MTISYTDYMSLRDAERAAGRDTARAQGRVDGVGDALRLLREQRACHEEALMRGPRDDHAYHLAAVAVLGAAIACVADARDQASIHFDEALAAWQRMPHVTVTPVDA